VATLHPGEDFHSLVNRADEALLSAKRAGKDRTVSAEK
jgi:PleD family two-component response regulator